MRGIPSLYQTLQPLRKHYSEFALPRLPGRMGRAVGKAKAEVEGTSQSPTIATASRIEELPTDVGTRKRRTGPKSKEEATSTSKKSKGYFDSTSQEAASLSSEAPPTPAQPTERRSSRRKASLARADTVTASIPQQIAAVATLPTANGQHTFQEAPVAVWSMELLREAADKLCAADPLLAPLIQEHNIPDRLLPTATDSAFHALAHVIMGQQLSVIAARNIAQKVKTACGCDEQLEPAAVLELSGPDLLACGLSRQKLAYITDLAQRFHSGTLETKTIVAMGDEALYEVLTAVKGIGRWSVDMFAMFHCGRLDILPVGDLAVRKGFQALYNLKAIPTNEEMETLAEKWRPYRSLGSYFMWRVPTQNLVKGKPGKKKTVAKAPAVPNTE